MSPKRASQADIAVQLGVSISTVSRALANEIGISEVMRAEVQKVARQLGYKSKHVYSVENLDRHVLALVPLGGATGHLTSFYHGIVEGMRAQAAELGIKLDVRLVNEDSVDDVFVQRQLQRTGASGLVLAGIDPAPEFAQWCNENEINLVLANGLDPRMAVSSVTPANFFGAYQATRYLLNAGHRKILHYTHQVRPTIIQRQRGYEAAMAEVADAVPTIVTTNDYTNAELVAALRQGEFDVTAVFCWNDIAAMPLVDALGGGEGHARHPLSIVGFDDLPIASMATPRLSTVQVDRVAMGRAVIRLLGQKFDGEPAVQQVEIGVTLIEGDTVAAIE
ncbi:LacI family DNA-binding transcriptional regulator [Devosia sp. WQ 349]|uniref:LacI family DNA-binding transcriptional regulator n=1 Tax=Devosia sp. WQ 349K1 TaxID=2800329 RepID=UPI001903B6D7|nr:LacI family DNA-binding transcriptional regulator [Devosia sp. WQ 349K1]MBK1793189.1 LacI family DNA-binding transcriptional regulator [Devosia sp. WQ 349K1]